MAARIDSWVQVMLGQRLEPVGHHAVGRMMRPKQLGDALARLAPNVEAALAKLPSHQQFLDGYCAAPGSSR